MARRSSLTRTRAALAEARRHGRRHAARPPAGRRDLDAAVERALPKRDAAAAQAAVLDRSRPCPVGAVEAVISASGHQQGALASRAW